MAIPKAAMEAIIKEVATSKGMRVEVRTTGNPITDGIYVISKKGQEAQFKRHSHGGIGIGWPEENFSNAPNTETQQEFKQRAMAILKDLM